MGFGRRQRPAAGPKPYQLPTGRAQRIPRTGSAGKAASLPAVPAEVSEPSTMLW